MVAVFIMVHLGVEPLENCSIALLRDLSSMACICAVGWSDRVIIGGTPKQRHAFDYRHAIVKDAATKDPVHTPSIVAQNAPIGTSTLSCPNGST